MGKCTIKTACYGVWLTVYSEYQSLNTFSIVQ